MAKKAKKAAEPDIAPLDDELDDDWGDYTDDDDNRFVGSLERGMKVIYAFGGGKRALGASEIAQFCGMSRGATQRMLYTLVRMGFLRRTDQKRQYQLGARLLDFAYLYMRADPVVNVASPYLMEARQALGLTVNLSLFDGRSMVYVIRTPGEQMLAPTNLVGRRVPTCSSSGGFAVLAHLPDEEVEKIIAETEFVQLTPHTTADPDTAWRKVREARETGYGYGDQEILLRELTIGAAVHDYSGRPVAAVHIPAYAPAMSESEMRARVAPVAISTAQAITRALGGKLW